MDILAIVLIVLGVLVMGAGFLARQGMQSSPQDPNMLSGARKANSELVSNVLLIGGAIIAIIGVVMIFV